MKVWLCGKDGCCPAVEFGETEVRIGEEGNLAVLTKEQWNDLVKRVKREELKALQG